MNIEVQAVSFHYPSGQLALDDVSLSISKGETVALIGENGAGKTTLVKQLNALLRPKIGRVQIGDWDVAERSTAQMARRVSFLFQNPDDQLFARRVWDEVAFGPRNLGLSEAEIQQRVRRSLERVGLLEKAESHPYDLQYTERKMIALAATLAMHAPILVLDEATIGQDARQRARVASILQELAAQGRTIVLVSHDLDFCAENAQRVVVMAEGRILADGSTAQVFAEGDILEQAAVIAPQLVRLSQALKLSPPALHVDDFVNAFARRKAGPS